MEDWSKLNDGYFKAKVFICVYMRDIFATLIITIYYLKPLAKIKVNVKIIFRNHFYCCER